MEQQLSSNTIYICPKCHAKMVYEKPISNCPYCTSPLTTLDVAFDPQHPDYILPFVLSKVDAKKKLHEFYRQHIFLPSQFKFKNHIEQIQGIYAPFWLYDAKIQAQLTFNGTKDFTSIHGDYIITTHDHYLLKRHGELPFLKIPADGSSQLNDAYMQQIEPYDYQSLQPFDPSLLPSYVAHPYDEQSDQELKKIQTRMEKTIRQHIEQKLVDFKQVELVKEQYSLTQKHVYYALLPIYILTTNYQGKLYQFIVNGQTGKFVGDTLPIDRTKVILYFILACSIGIGILFIILIGGYL